MKRNPKKHRKTAKVLTDPEPRFVSIVKAGANMTPLLAVKRANPLEEDDMKITVARSDDHDIAEIRFDKATFKDEAAVKSWLEAGGYAEYDIIESDPGFVVKGVEGLADLREITADGITTVVGKRQVEAAKEEVDPGAKAEAQPTVVSTKSESEADPKGEVPEEAAKDEAVQPVAPLDVTAVAAKADEHIATLKAKGLYDIMTLGEVLYALKWMVVDADYTGLPEDKVTELKGAAGSLLGVMDWFMTNSLDSFSEAFKKDTQKQEEIPAAAAGQEEQAPEPAAKEDPPAVSPEPIDEMTALKEQLAALQKSVAELTSTASQKASGEDTEGVKPVERQTRKGADVSDAKPEPKVVSKRSRPSTKRWPATASDFKQPA